jgi:aspartate carbamoyltransferase catalytic subunit
VKHLLGIEHLSRSELDAILKNAEEFVEVSGRDIKKVPSLRGKTVINLFLESSTRTRSSFEIAAKRLSADTINIGANDSSVTKGETLLDTARTLEAMRPDILIVRHKASGAADFLAKHLQHSAIVNAGDGTHEHPTQALLDLLSLKQRFKDRSRGLEGLTVAIVGDVLHSRVARSNIWAHRLLGNKVRLVGPRSLLPTLFSDTQAFPALDNGFELSIHHDLHTGLQGADVVLCLRMQLEREAGNFVPSLQEYSREFCVSERVLAKVAPHAVVMHPGPMNRGTEISGELADGARSLIINQVANGVAVRMAVLFMLSVGAHPIALDEHTKLESAKQEKVIEPAKGEKTERIVSAVGR